MKEQNNSIEKFFLLYFSTYKKSNNFIIVI